MLCVIVLELFLVVFQDRPRHRAWKSSAVHDRCFTGIVAPSATYSESLELTLHFLALISGTKVNWDNSEFTPISLRGWFKNTCNVSFKIISFDWKYLEMFLSTGFKRCHFFMNAESLINKIPKALTQLSGLQLFLFLLLRFVKINAIKKNSQQLCWTVSSAVSLLIALPDVLQC